MKKNKIYNGWDFHCLKKTIRIMRIAVFLVLAVVFQTLANESYSQKTKLTIDFSSTKLTKVLDEIENQTEFYFLFNEKLVDTDREVTLSMKNQRIEDILSTLFAGTDVVYTITDRKIILAPSFLTEAQQPQHTISGKVTGVSGDALPGVTVAVKGKTQGTVTDVNGNYSLSNIPPDAVLVFSFVGMKTQEFSVTGKTVIDVSLAEDAIGIEEVVAIGYGTMKKRDLTGSITSVKIDEELKQLPNVSVVQTLHGTVAGLNVGPTNQPGEEPSLSIRGYNTLSTSASANAPLIVVDGAIYRGNLIDLNNNDIETIDILKDASSAAIYGSQASNGVILITTRKGVSSTKPVFNYSSQYSMQTPHNPIEPMGKEELEQFILDCNWDRGGKGSRLAPDYLQPNPDFNFTPYFKTPDIQKGYAEGLNNDWWGLFTRNGSTMMHNLSVSGRNTGLGYYVSGGYSDVKGFALGDNYKKYNLRINLDAKINEWLKVGVESSLASSDYSGVAVSLGTVFTTQPWSPIYNENGEYILNPNGQNLNPYLTLKQEDDDKRFNVIGNFHADIDVPFITGLSYRINYTQNYRILTHDNYNPYGADYTGLGYKNFNKSYMWALDNIITYKRTFNEIHNVNLTLVYGVDKLNISYTNSSGQNFTDGSLGYNRLQAGDPSLFLIETGAEKETSLYTSARLFYSLKNRYLFTGTVRRDGFSGFGSNKKIGVFPSFSLGWVTSEESFFNIDWFNYLKFRATYGASGRRAVNRYETRAVVSSEPTIIFGDGGSATIGQWISKMANDDLGWETTTGFNFGADFGFLDSRIHGNVEYYSNNTKDILYNIQLPTMTGFSSIPYNIGKVHNNGIEFSITGNIINAGDLSWEASVNFSRNRNEIVSILGAENDQDGDGKEDDLVANSLFIGQPQNVIYDYEITGELWQLADQNAGVIPSGFFPGTLKIVDQNDDKAFSATNDRKILGYTDPSFRLGIANTLRYKNFSLYMFINSIQGGKDYYKGKAGPSHFDNLEFITQGNGPKGGFDYWMPENPNSKYPRLDKKASYQGFHYDQRNFIRLQDVSLSYTFNKNLIRKLSINNLKVFLSGQNLLTLTRWEGLDPELGISIVYDTPMMSSYTLGVNIEF